MTSLHLPVVKGCSIAYGNMIFSASKNNDIRIHIILFHLTSYVYTLNLTLYSERRLAVLVLIFIQLEPHVWSLTARTQTFHCHDEVDFKANAVLTASIGYSRPMTMEEGY